MPYIIFWLQSQLYIHLYNRGTSSSNHHSSTQKKITFLQILLPFAQKIWVTWEGVLYEILTCSHSHKCWIHQSKSIAHNRQGHQSSFFLQIIYWPANVWTKVVTRYWTMNMHKCQKLKPEAAVVINPSNLQQHHLDDEAN